MSETPTLEEQVIANLFSTYEFTLNNTRTRLKRDHKTLMSATFLLDEKDVMKKGIVDPSIGFLVDADSFRVKIYGKMIDKLREVPIPQRDVNQELMKFGEPGEDLHLVRDIRSVSSQDKGFIVDTSGRVAMGFLAYQSLCLHLHGKMKGWDREIENLLDPTIILEDWTPFGPSRAQVDYRLSYGKKPITLENYNTFEPPELYDYENPGKPVMPSHFEEYFRYFTGDCDIEYGVLLWWLKMTINGIRANNILIISGRGGIGKTIFSDRVLNGLLGSANTAVTDAVNIARETSNAEFSKKLAVTLEEMGLYKKEINKLKQGASERIRIRQLYHEPRMEENRTNVLILTNPDTGKIHANANERRFHALKTPTETLEERFGPQSEVIEKVKDCMDIGNLYAFLRDYEPDYPLTSSEIGINNPKYFELVIDAYSDRSTGEYEFLNMLVMNFDTPFTLNEVTFNSNTRSGTSYLKHTAAKEFLDGWRDVHLEKRAPAKLYRDRQGIWTVLSKIRSIEELINSKTPGYVYEDDSGDVLEPSNALREMLEDM